MTAEKTTISYHASEERIERLTACLATLGMNEYVLSVKDNERNNNTTKFLTDTGIIIIRNSDNGNIVTGYMASVSQAARMYKMAGFEKMPNGMYKKVTSNNKKHKNLLEIQKQFLTFQKFYIIIIIQKQKELLIMNDFYNTIVENLSGLTVEELDYLIEVAQNKKEQIKAEKKDTAATDLVKAFIAYKEATGGNTVRFYNCSGGGIVAALVIK